MTGPTLPPLTDDTAKPGTELNSYEVVYGRLQIEDYLRRTGESLVDYKWGSVQHAPAGLVVGAYGRLIHGTYDYKAGVHVSSSVVFARLPREDEHITVRGSVLDLFERSGDKYVRFSVELYDHSGTQIARIEHVSIYAFKSRAGAS